MAYRLKGEKTMKKSKYYKILIIISIIICIIFSIAGMVSLWFLDEDFIMLNFLYSFYILQSLNFIITNIMLWLIIKKGE